MKKIIVVDDEASISTLLEYNLSKAGYDVSVASDGLMAIKLAEADQPDLMILDLMLPGMDGLDVCRHIRQQQWVFPIIMVTAKDDEFDKVLGLELGADDYITKPFSPREVTARVKTILRRFSQSEACNLLDNDKISIGELAIYPDKYEATIRGEELELTPKEFELLVYLAKNKKRVLSRGQLLNAIWEFDFLGETRIVDVHISHLREKIEADTKKPVYIKTIRGLGYKLEAPEFELT
ncbi:two-component system alkaline phosphatase synthesis response regulator PhoP [Scopulibacillus darangshiensis]|uniref:Two-component system alkaline phosphatase synthesis response regulator PhoP n=1 Tax=Scopulibacillus darangshiensis TaxID=442528 RepID=A0A4R2P5A0_9BACL|nr:response regulator transcription factor [Scopulibacillus darangshiensis]TCP28955.1 two-component system alkaline phosphatase synthesis response regulator PhoP [Scopulibacillus darangshiensis]